HKVVTLYHYQQPYSDMTDLDEGEKGDSKHQQACKEPCTLVDDTFHLRLNVEPDAAVERNEKQFETGVLKRIAQRPVEHAPDRYEEEEENKSRGRCVLFKSHSH